MTSQATCPLCSRRKAKRLCPALERTICPVCCGTKRLVEIRCPPSCPYLSSARSHPAAIVQRREDRDLEFFVPLLSNLTEVPYQLLLGFQGVTVKHAESAIPPLLDVDVADAAAAVAATLETAGKGIIFEHQPTSLPAQRLAATLREAIRELTPEGHTALRFERDAAVALRRHEEAARKAEKALAGDAAPVYLNLLGRMMTRLKENAARERETVSDASDAVGPSRLIIPG
jgi:hypothetical protein